MPTAPIQDLKRNLADWLRVVEDGEIVTITRRNRPVALLTPVRRPGRNVGSRFGAGELVPLPFMGGPVPSPGAADDVLRVLADDRSDDR